MFQQYVSPAAIDPNLPFLADVVGGALHTFSPEFPGVSFSSNLTEFPMSVTQLNLAPRDALMVFNVGLHKAALSSSRVVFFDAAGLVTSECPVPNNGLGLTMGAVSIPRDAVKADFYVEGTEGFIAGQIRVVMREHIPYQPLKG